MNSTAEIPQPQIDTRRLLVRVLSLHEESDRICCEEKTKMLSQLKSNPCIMYFLAREKTLPIDYMLQNTPKNMFAVQLLSHTLFTQKGKRNKKKPKTKQIISLIPMRFVYFPSFKYYFVFIGRFASLWGFLSFAFPEHVENEWAFFVLNGFPGPEARFSNVAKALKVGS